MLKHKENYQRTARSVVGRTHDFVDKNHRKRFVFLDSFLNNIMEALTGEKYFNMKKNKIFSSCLRMSFSRLGFPLLIVSEPIPGHISNY